jgi:hypothetical protein
VFLNIFAVIFRQQGKKRGADRTGEVRSAPA